MNDVNQFEPSPRWGSTTKLVAGLTLIGSVAALLYRFRTIIGPMMVAFMLAYLLYPIIDRLSSAARISWRSAVNIIYLIVVIVVGGSITVAGLAIIQQIQSLVSIVQRFVNDLPELVASLASQTYSIGPFTFNVGEAVNLQILTDQLLAVIQPLLGQLGSILRSFAGSAAGTLGWLLFILIIAYFLLSESRRVPDRLVNIEVPGYDNDIRMLGEELRKIWNAYFRGQLTITILVMIVYAVLMVSLGVRYALGIAILAGLSRFVPYLGQLTVTIVTGMVTFFQGYNYFGLEPLQYVLVVIIIMTIVDQILDNLIAPRILGHQLRVHPAAVLIAAIVAFNLIGIIGLILAAPVLATVNLIGRYVLRKMFDLNPWDSMNLQEDPPTIVLPWEQAVRRLQVWGRLIRTRLKSFRESGEQDSDV